MVTRNLISHAGLPISVLCLALIFPVSSSAVVTFDRAYGGAEMDMAYCVCCAPDGGYVAVGATQSFGAGQYDVYLLKVDSLGRFLWDRTFGGFESDVGYSLERTSDGGYIIVGEGDLESGNGDVYLVRTDSLGHKLWERTYGGQGTDYGASVQQTRDGGYVVVGVTQSQRDSLEDIYFLRTDSAGRALWERTYGGGEADWGKYVRELGDGGYLILGITRSFGAGGWDIYLIRTDPLGTVLWDRTYGGNSNDYGSSFCQILEEGFLIVGTTQEGPTGLGDVYMVRTDPSGDVLWDVTYGGTNIEYGDWVEQTSDGGYIVVGATFSFGSGVCDVYIVKTDSMGAVLWERPHGASYWDRGYCIREALDGGYIIAGETFSFGARRYDMYLVKTDEIGLLRVCQPTEPPQIRSQGYWKSLCRNDAEEDVCAYVDSVRNLADLFDAFDCDSICNLMKVSSPENDMCRKARRQYMALLLNVASGKLAVCNCLEDGREVGDVVAEIDSLLFDDPDFHTCEYTKTLADGINNGIGIVPCDTFYAPIPPKSVLPICIVSMPNPFVNSTVIRYELTTRCRVRLEVYDKAGRLVRTLADGVQEPGLQLVEWGGLDGKGKEAPAGVYFTRLQIGNSLTSISKKLVFLP